MITSNSKHKQKALFLDRDGVINKDPDGYFCSDDIEYNIDLLEYVRDNFQDYKIFIVTNQSGIERGYFTKNDFLSMMAHMINDLKPYFNIEDIAYCPYISNDMECRKPNIGMFTYLIDKYDIDIS